MSIVSTREQADTVGPRDGAVCFFCGRPLEGLPLIIWAGCARRVERDDLSPTTRVFAEAGSVFEGLDVWLHPHCARALVLRLARDVAEWERRVGDGEWPHHREYVPQ